MNGKSAVDVNVAVDDAHLATFDETVDDLRRAGMEVDHMMKSVGVVSGRVSERKLEKLRKVAGVAAVDRQKRLAAAVPGRAKARSFKQRSR